jgi:ribosomal protein S18 acetylase RimI-like enzyme
MSDADYTIRRAVMADAAALPLVGSATMLETYTRLLPGVDILVHCTLNHSVEKYAGWVGDPACVIWIAEAVLGAPIGYLVLIPASVPVEAPSARDLEVLRIYVLAPYHKAGIGHRLMNLAAEEARGRGALRLVLGVHNDNARALTFYRRQGFEVIAARRFVVGGTVCSDSVLGLSLG